MRPRSLSSRERKRVIRDIFYWKTELERTGGRRLEDPVAFIDTCRDHDDEELVAVWYGTVGEWVLSRRDTTPPRTVDTDTFLNYQLGRLLNGDETAYGFIVNPSFEHLYAETSEPDHEAPTPG